MKSGSIFAALCILGIAACIQVSSPIPSENKVTLPGQWLPSDKDKEKAESAALKYLQDFPPAQKEASAQEVAKIRQNISGYRVQFRGIIVAGKRRVWMNFFPAVGPGEQDSFHYWEKQPVIVFDGGFWFWQLEFDKETGKCMNLMVNGYA